MNMILHFVFVLTRTIIIGQNDLFNKYMIR